MTPAVSNAIDEPSRPTETPPFTRPALILMLGLAMLSLSGCLSSSSGSSSTTDEPVEESEPADEMDDLELPHASAQAIGYTNPTLGPDEGALLIAWELADQGLVDICIATEQIRLPDNCSRYRDSRWLPSVSESPLVVQGLDPEHLYHVVVSGNGESITTETAARPASFPLNITGINWCAALDENFLDCPIDSNELPGQDGEVGRHLHARDGGSSAALGKLGAGPSAFDFTKLDKFGNALSANAEQWDCVRDNRTGLIWEIKSSTPENTHYRGHTYSWYKPSLGNNAGSANGGECAGPDCDTASYAENIRNDFLCAVDNWRVPTATELTSIMNYDATELPLWVEEALPDGLNGPLWTATPSASDNSQAWTVIEDGTVASAPKTETFPLRLVSSELPSPQHGSSSCGGDAPSATPTSAFLYDDKDATTLHKATGLEWSRCVLGQVWDEDTESCTGTPETHNWPSALQAVDTKNGDWRLPDVHEARSIVEPRCHNPAINTDIFPDAPANRAWTATPSAMDPEEALIVDFATGADQRVGKTSGGHVRMVRDTENAEAIPSNETIVIAAHLSDGPEFAVDAEITVVASSYNGGSVTSYSEFNLLATNTENDTTQTIGSTFYDGPPPGTYHLGMLSITGHLSDLGTYNLVIENRATGNTRNVGTAEIYTVAIRPIAASVADLELSVGEETEVIGSVYSPGPVGGEQQVTLTVNGEPYLSTTLTASPGTYLIGAINFPFSAQEAGTYELELVGVNADGTPNSRAAGTVEVTAD